MAGRTALAETVRNFQELGTTHNKMKIAGYHEGDRSEYLAQFALSTISYCVPVLRQVDYFFCDFLCVLFREGKKQNTFESTGRSLGIQIKSNNDQIEIKKERVEEFHGFTVPLFVGKIDKQAGVFSVYATTLRLLAALSYPDKKLILDPKGQSPEINVCDDAIGLKLGLPIVEVDITVLDDSDKKKRREERNRLFSILDSWTILEMANLAWKLNKIPWIQMPKKIRTNELPKFDDFEIHIAKTKDYLSHAKTSVAVTVMGLKMYLEGLCEGDQANEYASLSMAIEELTKKLGC